MKEIFILGFMIISNIFSFSALASIKNTTKISSVKKEFDFSQTTWQSFSKIPFVKKWPGKIFIHKNGQRAWTDGFFVVDKKENPFHCKGTNKTLLTTKKYGQVCRERGHVFEKDAITYTSVSKISKTTETYHVKHAYFFYDGKKIPKEIESWEKNL